MVTQDIWEEIQNLSDGRKKRAGVAMVKYMGRYLIVCMKLNELGKVSEESLHAQGELLEEFTATLMEIYRDTPNLLES